MEPHGISMAPAKTARLIAEPIRADLLKQFERITLTIASASRVFGRFAKTYKTLCRAINANFIEGVRD